MAESRKDPQARKDPRPRPAYEDAGQVVGADPSRKYVLVYKPQIERYQEIGWELERKRSDGPRMRGSNAADGDVIEYSGHALMSMSKADHADMEKYGFKDGGAPNGSGQEHADRFEKHLISQRAAQDGFRAIGTSSGGRYFNISNETSPETVEHGR